MPHHIQEITVHDYKGIHELKLSGLNNINILTGNNNSGKTSILELLGTTAEPEKLSNWFGRICNTLSSANQYCSYYEALINLFPCDQEDKHISYEFVLNSGQSHVVTMRGGLIADQLPESELFKINGFRKTGRKPKNEQEAFIDVQGMEVSIFKDGESVDHEIIYDKQHRLRTSARHSTHDHIVHVSAKEHNDGNRYLNIIFQYPEYYDLLICILKCFDDELIGINAVKTDADNPGTVNYLVQSKSHKRSLPLYAYGDGLQKAVLLLSALIQARNGMLLIDEFETGIHTSCMEQVFTLLLENAIKLNVQIFMTTHSLEALQKIIHTPLELQEKINLYTLYRSEGQNLVRPVSCLEAVEMNDQLGLELRS